MRESDIPPDLPVDLLRPGTQLRFKIMADAGPQPRRRASAGYSITVLRHS